MRRRLLLLAAVSSTLVLIVLLVAVLPLIRSRVTERLDDQLRQQILSVAAYVLDAAPDPAELEGYLRRVDVHDGTRIGVLHDGVAVGRGADLVRSFATGPHAQSRPRSIVALETPRFYVDPAGDRVASLGISSGTDGWVINGLISKQLLDSEERHYRISIGAFSALALLVSLLGADLLARRITRPIAQAARTAEAIGRGDLRAPVPTRGPREVTDLGAALATLGSRIERLLTSERERAAYLSHTLRTPLTAVSLEADRLRSVAPLHVERLTDSIAQLESALDEVIRESRRAREHGVATSCDAAAVVQRHIDYWRPLAAVQHRTVTATVAGAGRRVAIGDRELGTVLDVLFSNVIRHTTPGTAFSVVMTPSDRRLHISVDDQGADVTADGDPRPTGDHHADTVPGTGSVGRSGSTGVGLVTARRAVEQSGGTLQLVRTTSGHSAVIALPWAP